MNHTAIAAAVLVSALITLGLRAFPFLLARIARRYDTTFAWLGRVMPPGVMTSSPSTPPAPSNGNPQAPPPSARLPSSPSSPLSTAGATPSSASSAA